MDDELISELASKAEAVGTNDVVANPRRYRNMINRLGGELRSSQKRARELSDRLKVAEERAAELALIVERVREEAEAYGAQPDVMEPCGAVAQSLRYIITEASEVLLELKADLWDEVSNATAEHIENGGDFQLPNPYREEQ